jgi:hypothetical protein
VSHISNLRLGGDGKQPGATLILVGRVRTVDHVGVRFHLVSTYSPRNRKVFNRLDCLSIIYRYKSTGTQLPFHERSLHTFRFLPNPPSNMSLSKSALACRALAAITVKANPLANLPDDSKFQICIHDPILHASEADFVPAEAAIFDIDMAHAQEFPDMIPRLKVRSLNNTRSPVPSLTFWIGS